MKLPTKPFQANNQVYIISKREVVYLEMGEKLKKESPQYHLGAFMSAKEARQKCEELNEKLWKEKESNFYRDLEKDREAHHALVEEYKNGKLEVDPGEFFEYTYNEKARRKDMEENYYLAIPVEIKV